jgi:hypothetical protein
LGQVSLPLKYVFSTKLDVGFFLGIDQNFLGSNKKLLATASMAILDEMMNIFQGTCKKTSSGLKNFGCQMYLFQHTCRIVLTKFSTQMRMEIKT